MKSTHYAVRDLRGAREAFRDVRIPERLWPEIEATFAAVVKYVPASARPPYLASCLVFHVVNGSITTPRRFHMFRERLQHPATHAAAVRFLNDPAMSWKGFVESCTDALNIATIMKELDEILSKRPEGALLDADEIIERLRARAEELGHPRKPRRPADDQRRRPGDDFHARH